MDSQCLILGEKNVLEALVYDALWVHVSPRCSGVGNAGVLGLLLPCATAVGCGLQRSADTPSAGRKTQHRMWEVKAGVP